MSRIWLLLILLMFGAEIEPVAAESLRPLNAAVSAAPSTTDCPDSLIPSFAADPLLCVQEDFGQVRSVAELQDVQPSDWAYQAVKALVEKYGVVAGYSDHFSGQSTAGRYEFVAVLNQVATKIEQLFITGELGKFAKMWQLFDGCKRLTAIFTG